MVSQECAGILRGRCQQDGSAFPLQRQDAAQHGRDEPRTDQGHMPRVFRYCPVVLLLSFFLNFIFL